MNLLGRNIIYDTVNIDIPISSTSFSKHISLRRGRCIGVKFVEISSTDRSNINVSVEDASGSRIVGSTDYRDYKGNQGGYVENYKPCNFDTSANIIVNIESDESIRDEAFKGQLIFMIDQTDY